MQTLNVNFSSHCQKFKTLLCDLGLDGFLLRNFEGNNNNVYYLSGFSGTTGVLLITKDGQFLITDARYWTRASLEAPSFTLVKLERGQKMIDAINATLVRANLGAESKIGFESHQLSFELANIYLKEIKASLLPVANLVEQLRQYKTPEEIDLIKQACDVTCEVFAQVAKLIEPGLREDEIAFELDTRLRKHGAIANSFPSIVASGVNSAVPHHKTSTRVVKAGEPVILDFGGLFPGGYCSDLTRTVFVPGASPNPKMVEIYKIVLEANRQAAKALKPGITWANYDKVARDYIVSRGYGEYFTHGLGHSVGLLVHDPFDYEKFTFEEGTVVTNEPGIYVEGLGGVRIEDDMVVTANGSVSLTLAPYLVF